MKFHVRLGAAARAVEIEREAGGQPRYSLDGRAVTADAIEIDASTYSILLDGRCLEVRLQSAPNGLRARCGGEEFEVQVQDLRAWRGAQGAPLAAEGRQQIAAPMPGKVVRVLVATGQPVEAGQGLAVVEAMKMQNEIRAPRGGTIERVFVQENQAVAAGEPLVIIA